MAALKAGKALLPVARNEIVDSIATLIMVHTMYPTSDQLEKVAMKLLRVYPSIADKVPGGIPYVSESVDVAYFLHNNYRLPGR